MAVTTATKKKLQMNGSDISPRTSLDNIMPNVSNFGGDATTIIHTSGENSGKIKAQYLELPSYVDDVVELVAYATSAPNTYTPDGGTSTNVAVGDQYFDSSTNATYGKKIRTCTAFSSGTATWDNGTAPEKGKIYVLLSSGKTYRWSGSDMVEIAKQLSVTNTIDTTDPSQDQVPTEYAVAQLLSGQLDVVVAGTVAEVELIAISSTAPSTCAESDKYFNTSSNKIFTATATNTWGTTGEDASHGVIYKYNNTLYTRSGDSTSTDTGLYPLQYTLSASGSEDWTSAPLGVVARAQHVHQHIVSAVEEAVTTRNAGTGISITNKNGATPFKIALAKATTSTIGGVYVAGLSSASNGVTLSLNASTGALTISATAADVSSTAGSAGSIGTVKLLNDFTGWFSGLSNFSAANNVVAVTPNGVATWVMKIFTEAEGLEISNSYVASISLATNPGLEVAAASGETKKKLKVKLASTGGLDVDANGLKAKINSTGGLDSDANGLKVKTKTNGGLSSDANGLYATLTAVDV